MREEAFQDFLVSRGLRLTRERHAIAREVMARQGHFDLEELHAELRRKGCKVSRASVYRTLPLLLQAGIVAEVELGDKQARYERTLGRRHHDHMLCLGCGRVIEFYSEALERLQEELCRREDFRGESHNLEIRGYCARCAPQRGKETTSLPRSVQETSASG
jgi:Fur family ferric uptake transcriptional regulator